MPRFAHSDGYAVVVEVLVAARKGAGVSQLTLANRLSKPQSFVSKIERRERRLDVLEFCAIVRAIGLQPAELMRQVDESLPEDIEL